MVIVNLYVYIRTVLGLLVVLWIGSSCGYCPVGWVKHAKTCYIMFPTSEETRKADKAADFCRQHGGTLMNIKTEELNNMAVVMLEAKAASNRHFAFIGLNDRGKEGDYRWSDNSSASYLNWKDGEPNGQWQSSNQDCAVMDAFGLFYDTPCDNYHIPIAIPACEKPIEEHIHVLPRKVNRCAKNGELHNKYKKP